MTSIDLIWVRTFGGPLILLPQDTLPHWHGSTEPDEDDDWDEEASDDDEESAASKVDGARREPIEADFRWMGPDGVATDYDRACDVAGSVAALAAGPGHAIVLNLHPQLSGALAGLTSTSALVVLNSPADPLGDTLDATAIRPDAFESPEIFFDVAEGQITLVDATCDGRDPDYCDSRSIELDTGRYSMRAGEAAASNGSLLPAYLLERVGETGERVAAELVAAVKSAPVRASHVDDDEPLFRVLRGRKWSFIDRQGRLAVETPYAHVGDYYDGRASFLSQGRSGFLDRAGQVVIPPIYDSSPSFADGLALVQRSGRYAFIGTDGQEPFPFRFAEASPFRDGRATVAMPADPQRWGCIDVRGELVIPCVYDRRISFQGEYATAERDGRQFVIDRDGAVVCELPPDVFVCRFVDGLAAYWRTKYDANEQKDVGYFDLQGRIALGPFTDRVHVSSFADGVAWFIDQHERYGLIDRAGRTLIEPKFRDLDDFCDGLAPASLESRRYGFVARDGEFAIEPRFHYATPFRDGLAKVELFGKWGYIDPAGDWVWEPTQ